MEGRKITNKERSCIAECIVKHWGADQRDRDPEERDVQYESCLGDCQICG